MPLSKSVFCFFFWGGGLIPATEVSAYNTNTSQLTLAAPCRNSIILLLTVFLPSLISNILKARLGWGVCDTPE